MALRHVIYGLGIIDRMAESSWTVDARTGCKNRRFPPLRPLRPLFSRPKTPPCGLWPGKSLSWRSLPFIDQPNHVSDSPFTKHVSDSPPRLKKRTCLSLSSRCFCVLLNNDATMRDSSGLGRRGSVKERRATETAVRFLQSDC